MPELSSTDKNVAGEFAAAITRRDFRTAAVIISTVTNAGETELAAQLLEAVIDAGVEAIQAMAGRSVTVNQTIGAVPEGATVVGFRGRIG
jgi:methylmalonyl-CoA mutase cobalamin-binding subunit